MFYSQDKQDSFLEQNVFMGFKNGIFIDVGAHDGVSFNNTLFFEKNHDWTGVNIEPIKLVFDNLVINRPNCININYAVCNENGETDFLQNTGYTEMISGIKNTFDSRHLNRLQYENIKHGSKTEIIKVKTKKIDDICNENNIFKVNYLSIDVEGAEFEVIKSINFDNIFIDVIGFENNYKNSSIQIVTYLQNKGYIHIDKYNGIDIFMIHKDSVFMSNI
jgi:FkbM family methyltransferase